MGACLSRRAAGADDGDAADGRSSLDADAATSPRALRLVLPLLSPRDAGAVRLTCRRWRLAASADVESLTLTLADAASPHLAPALGRAARAFAGARRVGLVRAGGWCDPLRARLELQPLVQARPSAFDLSPLAAAFDGLNGSPTPAPQQQLRALSLVDATFTRHPWPLAEVARRFASLEELEVCWPAALWAPGQLLHEWEALRGLFEAAASLPAADPKARRRGAAAAAPAAAAPAAPPLPHLRSLTLRKAAAAHLGHPPLGDSAVAAIATAPGPLPTSLVSLTLEAVSLGDAGARSLALLPGLESLALRGRLSCSLLALRDGLMALTRLTALDLGHLAPPEQEVRELAAEAAAVEAAVGGGGNGEAGASSSPQATALQQGPPAPPPVPPPSLPRPARSPLMASTPHSSSGGGGASGSSLKAATGAAQQQQPLQPQQQPQPPSYGYHQVHGSNSGTVLRFHSAFGHARASSSNGVAGAPSRALLAAGGGGGGGSGGDGPSPPQQQSPQTPPAPAQPTAASALGADWSRVFAPLSRLRRLSLSTDLALLGGLETLRGGGGAAAPGSSPPSLPELCDVRLHATSARFARAEQRSQAKRRQRRRRQQQQQREGTARAPALELPPLAPCWFDEGADAAGAASAATPPQSPLRGTPALPRSPLPALPHLLSCTGTWRALTSLQVDGLDHADGFCSGAARLLGLRTLVVSGAMRTRSSSSSSSSRGSSSSTTTIAGLGLARLATLAQLRRLEWRPARRCAPEFRPTEAALSRLAEGATALTTLHLSLFSDGKEEQTITAFGRMHSLKHLSLELLEAEEEEQGEDEARLAGGRGRAPAIATATAPSPPPPPIVDWRRGLPPQLESLSLARFGELAPDDWTAAAAACPGLLHLRLVGCCGGGRRQQQQQNRSGRPPPRAAIVAPLDAHAWRIAQAWPGLLTLVMVKKSPYAAGGGGGGLGSAGVAACARLSRLRALAITLEDGASASPSSSSARGGGGCVAATLGESAPADVRPLALLAPTLEFLLLDSPAGSCGAPPAGARYALRALQRLRLLAMPLLSLHAARAVERGGGLVVGRGVGVGSGGGTSSGGSSGHGSTSGGGGGGGGADAALAAAAAAVAAAAALAAGAAAPEGHGVGGVGGVSGAGGHYSNALAAIEAALPRCHLVDLPSAPWAEGGGGGGVATGGGGNGGEAARWMAATTPEERDWWRAPRAGEAPAWEWRPTFCVLAG